MRGCYDGMEPYLGTTRGDEWGCIGSWFSGSWRSSSSLGYISKVQSSLNSKAWLSWPDQSSSLPAAPSTPQVTLPPVTRAPATPAAPTGGGVQTNGKPAVTTTTQKPAAQPQVQPQVQPPVRGQQPQVTTTTVTAHAGKPAVKKTHLNELRKLRRELNAYCKRNSC